MIRVLYIDEPQGAQKNAKALSASAAQPFSVAQSVITGGADLPYATLETRGWPLDGSRSILPDRITQAMGWWSAVRSDPQTGRFDTPPVITVEFDQPYTAAGITLLFSESMDQWCNDIGVRWFNGGEMLENREEFPTAPEWVVRGIDGEFDRLEITLYSTHIPGQYAKVSRIQIGQVLVFGEKELESVGTVSEFDPLLCTLPVDEMRISVKVPESRLLIPQENQRMELHRDGQMLEAQYIRESSKVRKGVYKFVCRSAVGLLEDDFMGGVYTGKPAGELLTEILGSGVSLDLDPAFYSSTISGYLPVCTRREALQQVAFALGARVSTHKTDAIKLTPPETVSKHTYTDTEIFAGASIESKSKYAVVELYAHRYTDINEEETLLEAEPVSGTNLLYTFTEPHHDYQITGGKLTAFGENWVQITASGTEVTLTAKKYKHTMYRMQKANPSAKGSEKNNVITVDAATLITPSNAAEVLERLYAAAQLRQELSQNAVISGQNAGMYVESVNPWETKTAGYIAYLDSTYTQRKKTASMRIIGAEVR